MIAVDDAHKEIIILFSFLFIVCFFFNSYITA